MPLRPTAARLVALAIVSLALVPVPALAAQAATRSSPKATPKTLDKPGAAAATGEGFGKGLAWRLVGPFRGGRADAVAGIPGDPKTYYMGSTGGGVWKTTDAGGSWKNVSDGAFGGSIGAVAVSAWDPNVVYVGTGEITVRGNVSHGDGVWKSTDAGATWKHVGLDDTRHVGRIRIHPKNPDLVYVAALGHLFGPNSMRGVYRSQDGGASWQRVLGVSDDVGAADLAMDPTNPRILYATTWRVRRTPWSLESGGPGSGLWKSTDGGDHWISLAGKKGLPAPPLGIAGIDVSAADPANVYAIVEAADGGVFRSRDGGETWQRTTGDRALRQRAWYYSRIYADPQDAEVVYVVNVDFHRSKDGGKTFAEIETRHGDHHDLWIAPDDPRRMAIADDGGAAVSLDGGASWSSLDNQPTAQIYRLSTDAAFPYRLLGGQQDNSALRIRSRSFAGGGISERDWEPTAGGESGTVVADPRNPDVVYGGSYGGLLMRLDHRTGEVRMVDVWPDNPMGWGAADLTVRFQWNYPLFFSPHDPGTLYAAGNRLFKTTDEGQSWQPVSPDLTRDDKSKQGPSGGPITKDNTSVEYYGTIFATAESPLQKGVLWAGSDDGLIHVSRDGGATWKNVTPKDLPEWSLVNSLEPSPFEPGGLYVAATRYKSDDFRPSLWKTTDYGATWKRIDRGIPATHFTRVIRADPARQGLLFAGTERGLYVSFDDGGSFRPFQQNLPIVPITDLAIRDGSLLAATQGRAFWALDDLALLRAWRDPEGDQATLFAPARTLRLAGGGRREPPPGAGADPSSGVVVHYWLPKAPSAPIEVAFLDGSGQLLRRFESEAPKPPAEAGADAKAEKPAGDEKKPEPKRDVDPAKKKKEIKAPAEAGLNRFVWDLRLEDPEDFPGMVLWNGRLSGPRIVPGTYQVRLTVDGVARTSSFDIAADPRSAATADDLAAQFDFLVAARDKLSEVHRAIRFLRDARTRIDGLGDALAGDDHKAARDKASALRDSLVAVEEALYQTKLESPQDPLNFPIRLNDKLAGVASLVAAGDRRPTDQALAVRDRLVEAIDAQLSRLREIVERDLPAFEAAARKAGLTLLPAKLPEPPAAR